MKRYCIFISIILISVNAFSQETIEDSLLLELGKASHDSSKVKILTELYNYFKHTNAEKSVNYIFKAKEVAIKCSSDFWLGKTYYEIGEMYSWKGEYELARAYLNKALIIFEKLEDKKFRVYCLNYLGQLALYEGKLDSSEFYYNKSLSIANESNNNKLISSVYTNIGNLNYHKGDYWEAIRFYKKVISYSNNFTDREIHAQCLNNLGNVYANLGSYAEALEYYQQAIQIYDLTNDERGIADCTNNIGLLHFLLGNHDKALLYFNKSSEIYEELDDVKGVINSLNNIGSLYFETGQYFKAIDNFRNSLRLSEDNNDKYNIGQCYLNIGESFFLLGELNKAEESLNKSLKINTQIDNIHGIIACYECLAKIKLQYGEINEAIILISKSLEDARKIGVRRSERDALKVLSNAYEQSNEFKEALRYYKLYKLEEDSLFNEENSKQINELETRYQTEKKQQQIELQETKLAQQEAEIEQQKILRNTLIGGLVSVVLIAILAGYAYYQKRISNKKIAAQKYEIEKQKGIIEKKNIHITDSINYAKRIQESVFLTGNEIKHHFKDSFLMNLPKDIVSGDFVWFTQVKTKKVFAVVDCTGHGVPGAFMSLIGNSLLNEIVKEKELIDPAEILHALHLGVMGVLRQDSGQSKSNDGMDMVLCVYDQGNKELKFSGARNFMYVKDQSELITLDGDPYSIGEIPFSKKLKVKFNTQTVQIKSNTKIYLMTDGYMDQFGGPKCKKFNQRPFEKIINEISDLSMTEQKDKFMNAFTEWKGEHRQIDDVMLLGINLS